MANEIRDAISHALFDECANRIIEAIEEVNSGCPEIEAGGVHVLLVDPSELVIKISFYDRQQPKQFYKVKITRAHQR